MVGGNVLPVVGSLILIVAFGWQVPLCFSSFSAFVRRNSVILAMAVVHRSVSLGVAQAIYLLSLDRMYLLLLGVWHLGIPLLGLAYYSTAKRRVEWPNLLLIGALFLAHYVVETHAYFTLVSQHDMGWVNRQEVGLGVMWGRLATQALIFLATMAIANTFEELFYRVTMFEVMQKLFGVKEVGTVVVTGILFGIAHSAPLFESIAEVQRVATVYNIIFTTLMGLALGLIYARHKELLLISLLHWLMWVANVGGRIMAGLLYYWSS
ncbi:MAG: CPBP family intramembrane metalloprotease [Thermaerobacter sp.]|nr:CPBP family intramembrane metalloprotease [Thermaerobacter sp.]